MCSCSKGKAKNGVTKYKVTYPNSATQVVTSELSAKLAAGKVPGAKYEAIPKTA